MDRYEARLAVRFNSICEYDGIRYYAYGLQYVHPNGRRPTESIILAGTTKGYKDCILPCTVQANTSQVKVLDWHCPEEVVKSELENLRKNFTW